MINSATLKRWKQLSTDLARIKAEEAKLRREICDAYFEGKVGDFKVVRETPSYKVTAKSRVTRSLDPVVLESLDDALTEEDKQCIKFKPSVVASAYKKLPEDSLLHEAITEKPAMPALEVNEI